MQHHPLGKASRKLHKNARDRAIQAIAGMIDRPIRKDKAKFRWSHQTEQWRWPWETPIPRIQASTLSSPPVVAMLALLGFRGVTGG
jgi:hypothetical protein